MIRHIVFDMGNVLLYFDENRIIENYTKKPAEVKGIKEGLFSGLWAELDKGSLTYDEVKAILKEKMSPSLYAITADLLDTWHEHMPVNHEMEPLLAVLKDNGYNLYLLSNASTRFEVYQERIPARHLFSGLVVSGYHQSVKPEKRIYEILFNTYHLVPSECAFIDDNPANTAVGEEFGMRTHVFDGNIGELLAFFDEIGVDYQKES